MKIVLLFLTKTAARIFEVPAAIPIMRKLNLHPQFRLLYFGYYSFDQPIPFDFQP